MAHSRYISIDVEACATGRGHNDRSPCQVAVVDDDGTLLLNEVICVNDIYDPMTSLTGVTREQILAGKTFEEVRESVIQILCPRTSIIVGCRPQGDVKWMKLEEGIHFASIVDLSDMLKAWNDRYKNYNFFSLRKMAYGLLGTTIQDAAHSPVIDAQISLEIYRKHASDPVRMKSAIKKLSRMTYKREFPEDMGKTVIVGDICSYKFNPKKCFCGQPTFA
jgi:DNA polymerase III epsilon subunit-like protein